MGVMRKGAAAAHKAVGHAAAAQRLGADGEPSEVLAKLKGSWQARWCRDADARERQCAEFTALRQAALREPAGEPLRGQELTRLARIFSKGTARGATGWSPADFAALSPHAAEQLAAVVTAVWEQAVMPRVALPTLMCFLAKPQGGHRGIALLDATYRLIMVWKKPSMMALQDAHTMHWHDAMRKPTPLRAALAKSILLKSGARLGLAVGQVLWVIEAFIDSFAVTDITRMAVRLGYPRRLLALALQQHTAPRIVTAMGAADTIHGINEGVLFGDAQSMGFAKIVTAQLLAQMHARYAPSAPRAYVDDMAQVCVAISQSALAKELQPAALYFAAELAKMGLRVSPKTVLAPPHSDAMRGLAKALGAAGVAVQLDAAARDLGVDAFTGARRRQKGGRCAGDQSQAACLACGGALPQRRDQGRGEPGS